MSFDEGRNRGRAVGIAINTGKHEKETQTRARE